MNIHEKEKDENKFEEQLNTNYPEVKIFGMIYNAGYVLKKLDPIAFRCAMADEPIIYVCGECQAEFEDNFEAEECCKE